MTFGLCPRVSTRRGGGAALSHLQQWQGEQDKGRQYDTSGRFINAMGGNREASRISSLIKFANN